MRIHWTILSPRATWVPEGTCNLFPVRVTSLALGSTVPGQLQSWCFIPLTDGTWWGQGGTRLRAPLLRSLRGLLLNPTGHAGLGVKRKASSRKSPLELWRSVHQRRAARGRSPLSNRAPCHPAHPKPGSLISSTHPQSQWAQIDEQPSLSEGQQKILVLT